jgi:uncharacterized NAD-dependent epimerase/dehydratase family protein
MRVRPPYLLFLGDVPDPLAAKTAQGVLDWRRDWCLAQMRLPGCGADLDLPEMQQAEAAAAGARTFVLGAVTAGGVLPEHWIDHIVAAIEAGLDAASGLHIRLGSVPAIATAARRFGRALHDLRIPCQSFATGKGTKRTGKRLLTVGTDCSVGKKYTALALERDMRTAGMDADFRATGQTGLLISGKGVPLDAVVADFIAGAAEWLTPDAGDDHWDLVEGQGSLFHPSFAGVTLGLLHGSQPDAFVVCHEPTRQTMRGVPARLPSIREVIDATTSMGRLTNPAIACTGIAVDTSRITEDEARELLASISAEHGVPATDPIRFGTMPIVEELRRRF